MSRNQAAKCAETDMPLDKALSLRLLGFPLGALQIHHPKVGGF